MGSEQDTTGAHTGPLEGAEVTECLRRLRSGDETAAEHLLPLVYSELRRLAQRAALHRTPDRTLQPTALVHEAYLRLFAGEGEGWENRRHFYSVAALAMRQLLTDSARERSAQKRGGALQRVELDTRVAAEAPDGAQGSVDHFALDAALAKLQQLNERQARIVELRYLVGLTIEETAETLGVSVRTVSLDWKVARAWLQRELAEG